MYTRREGLWARMINIAEFLRIRVIAGIFFIFFVRAVRHSHGGELDVSGYALGNTGRKG